MTQPTPPATPPASDPPAPAADDKKAAEDGYWAKLKSTVNEVVDERLKEVRDRGLSPQRTGRTTIFDIIGDFMWGPQKTDKK